MIRMEMEDKNGITFVSDDHRRLDLHRNEHDGGLWSHDFDYDILTRLEIQQKSEDRFVATFYGKPSYDSSEEITESHKEMPVASFVGESWRDVVIWAVGVWDGYMIAI